MGRKVEMNEYYIDWSSRKGVLALMEGAEKPVVFETLFTFVESLNEPSIIYIEATYESFDLKKRREFEEICFNKHVLWQTPNRLTQRMRKRLNFSEKTDENDTFAIRGVVKQCDSLKKPRPVDQTRVLIRVIANKELMLLRRRRQKDVFAETLIVHLPSPETLTDTQKIALLNGDGKYSKPTVAAVGIAAKFAYNQKGFDFLAGLHAHGYPSQIRADLHHYNWSGGNTRRKLSDHKHGYGKRDDIKMSDWRREMRWLFHKLRKLYKENPGLWPVIED